MSPFDVVVIDYGVGNLLSVQRGLERCGARVMVTDDLVTILAAPRVILPGVGAFADGMTELRSRGLDAVVRAVAAQGAPLLGICLGMELLLDESEEFGITAGLGLIPGRVIPVPPLTDDGRPQKIPHIGWNSLVVSDSRRDWRGTLLATTTPGEAVYFVHSYMASPSKNEHRLADCLYGGASVSAVIQRYNVLGCQFHPEKSGEVGLNILRQFLVM
jgi:glutamine amidotransferase